MAIKTDPWYVLDGFMLAMLGDPTVQDLLERLREARPENPRIGSNPGAVTDDELSALANALELDIGWRDFIVGELAKALWWWRSTAHADQPGRRDKLNWYPLPSDRQRRPRLDPRVAGRMVPRVPRGRSIDPEDWERAGASATTIASPEDDAASSLAARDTGRRMGETLYRLDVKGEPVRRLAGQRYWDADSGRTNVKRDRKAAHDALVVLATPGQTTG